MIISYDAVMQDQPFYAHLYFKVQTVSYIWFKESFFRVPDHEIQKHIF